MEMSSREGMDRRDTEPADREGAKQCKQLPRRKLIAQIDQKVRHLEPGDAARAALTRAVAARGLSEAFASVSEAFESVLSADAEGRVGTRQAEKSRG